MKITVHGVDISSFLLTDSFLLDRYGANRSSFSFALAVFSDSGKSSPVIEAGMEVKLYGDEETVVWGGVVDRLSVFKRSGRLREFRVSCYGYEQILYRLAIEPFYAKAANVGRAAQVLFTRYLLPEGLKASAGNFSMSGTITEYASGKWKMLFRVFDELADLYGHCWWVDQQKNFFFRDSMPATETGRAVHFLVLRFGIPEKNRKLPELPGGFRPGNGVRGGGKRCGNCKNGALFGNRKVLRNHGKFSY